MNTDSKVVRLKPFDPSRGQVMRDYTARNGTKFLAGVWYDVDEATANYLRDVHELIGVERSPLAFDVCTRAEAEDLMAAEEQRELGRVVPDALEAAAAPVEVVAKPDRALNRPKPKHELSAAAAAHAPTAGSDLSDAAAADIARTRASRRPRPAR